jgi:hypothetical protein
MAKTIKNIGLTILGSRYIIELIIKIIEMIISEVVWEAEHEIRMPRIHLAVVLRNAVR